MPANVVTAFKIYEVAKYFTEVGFGATMAGILTINLDTWEKLPKQVQDIILEVGSEWFWDVYKRGQELEEQAISKMKSEGVTIYKLPEEERAKWAKRLNDARVAAKTIANAKKNNYPADEIAKFYIKTMIEDERYHFPYPPILDLN
jgi:TRAP-type C4-dicarboxylate transport system substrate-binding protein